MKRERKRAAGHMKNNTDIVSDKYYIAEGSMVDTLH